MIRSGPNEIAIFHRKCAITICLHIHTSSKWLCDAEKKRPNGRIQDGFFLNAVILCVDTFFRPCIVLYSAENQHDNEDRLAFWLEYLHNGQNVVLFVPSCKPHRSHCFSYARRSLLNDTLPNIIVIIIMLLLLHGAPHSTRAILISFTHILLLLFLFMCVSTRLQREKSSLAMATENTREKNSCRKNEEQKKKKYGKPTIAYCHSVIASWIL